MTRVHATPSLLARGERAGTILIAGIAAALVLVALVINRDFWLDEAMVYQAIAGQPFLPPGTPLNQYEQTLPYGVYFINKVLIDAVGLTPWVLRLPAIFALVIGFGGLYLATRSLSTPAGRLGALFFGVITYHVVLQATMFKHYTFEFAAAAAIIAAGITLITNPPRARSMAIFAAIAMGALPFSNTAVFVTLTVLVSAALCHLASTKRLLFPGAVTLVGAGGVYLVAFAAWYLLVMAPANVWQLGLPIYADTSVLESIKNFVAAVAGLFAPTVIPGLFQIAPFLLLPGVVLLWGFWIGVRQYPRVPPAYLILVILLLASFAAAVLGLAPFLSPRHVLFVMPAVALALGQAIGDVYRFVEGRYVVTAGWRSGTVALSALSAVGLVVFATMSATSTIQETKKVLVDTQAICTDVYVDFLYQPQAEMFIDHFDLPIVLHGEVDTRSGAGSDSWLSKVTEDVPAYQNAALAYFEDRGSGCVLTGERPDQLALLITPIEASGFTCTSLAERHGAEMFLCESAYL